jgi:hypothetical protein
LELNSWITFPHPLVNNIYFKIFGGKFSQVGSYFWGKIKNYEISKNFFEGVIPLRNKNICE